MQVIIKDDFVNLTFKLEVVLFKYIYKKNLNELIFFFYIFTYYI